MTIKEYFDIKASKIEDFLDLMDYEGEKSYVLCMCDNFDGNGLIDWAEENEVDLWAVVNGELVLDRWIANS